MPAGKHNAVVIKEFTKKADAFSDWLARPSFDEVLEQMLRMAEVRRTDRVLAVGCGPGLVACRFAADACHVTGIDLTPAFLDHARKLQVKTGLANLFWEIGDAQNLRYPDESFDIVVTRFAFHHISRRKTAFREMVRVCKPGGVILLADLVISARKRAVFNGIERSKDPSHVSAMTRGEYTDLARSERLGGSGHARSGWRWTWKSSLAR